MSKPHVFFDFDGTLADASEGILLSFAHALTVLGHPVPSREKLLTLIGPPLLHNFKVGLGLDDATAERAVPIYREYYRDHGIYQCHLYDGMREMLRALAGEAPLVVATCKPEAFAVRLVRYLGVEDCFALVAGANMDGTRAEKEEVIAHAMETLGITDPRDVMMVGDRSNDVKGAAQVGVSCLGVLWGFGSERELREAGAIEVCSSPLETETFLKEWISLRKNSQISLDSFSKIRYN